MNPSILPAQHRAADETESIYVVLTHSQSIVSRAIATVTQDEYTHAAIALEGDLDSMYSFGRRWSRYPFWGCFKRENFAEGFYARGGALPGVVLRVEVSARQYQRIAAMIEEFQARQGSLRYDTVGLLIGAFGLPSDSASRYTCSKFVADVLGAAGVHYFDKPLSLVRPQDLLALPGQVVYQGDLKEYYRMVWPQVVAG